MIRVCLPLLLFLLCCNEAPQAFAQKKNAPGKTPADSLSVYEQLFDTLLADGFDFPFGDGEGGGSYKDSDGKTHNGWYIATHTAEAYSLGIHTGEDWNGNGGGNTDLGQPVFSTAKGRVIASADFGKPWGNIILIEHHYIDNAKPKTVYSLYAHLDKRLAQKNDVVKRRQKIGTIGTGGGSYPAHLHFEIRKAAMKDFAVDYWPSDNGKNAAWVLKHYEKPSEFIKSRRKLLVPAAQDTLLVAVKNTYRMKLYARGREVKEYRIALAQEPIGHKQQQGDNRTPEGEYKIIQKALGPFTGNYANYLGKAWMRINYPNNHDADAALAKKKITQTQYNSILAANKAGKEPLKTTVLGGGIGIHGWDGNWPGNDKQNLTWGCISVQNNELIDLYKRVPVYTKILILP
ncbi:MAG: peptidoglycan DD-metalloendopeptidase family protein [Bacteroidia bacterium]|jgi:hypothetical protein|nr:peptidoglycan DD-metalloendopeptidase family protein [Bacteroidia bacterium]